MNSVIANFKAKEKAWYKKHAKGLEITRKTSLICAIVFGVLWLICAVTAVIFA